MNVERDFKSLKKIIFPDQVFLIFFNKFDLKIKNYTMYMNMYDKCDFYY